MKIGIISINMYSKGLNFACPLHTWAFQQLLFQHGIDNEIINYKPVYYNDFDLKHPADYYDKLYRSMEKQDGEDKEEKLKELAYKRDSYKELYCEREIRYDKFQKFIDKHYVKTDKCYNSDLLEVLDPGFDGYICATDVIWKNEPGYGFDRGFFLGSQVMENKWKIAYSASRGRWYPNNEEEKALFFHYIEDIDFLSVREKSLQMYIEDNSDKRATVVLDPVLLHKKEFWEKVAVTPKEKKYLLLYHVVEEAGDTIEQAIKYARKYDLTIVEVSDKPLEKGATIEMLDKVIYRYDIGVEEWLGYILYADCVFTNSFHGCCFSVLFEKELFVGNRLEDKVDNLLEAFNIMNRKLQKNSSVDEETYPQIDYEKVNRILVEKRKESIDFLISSISRCENCKKDEKDYSQWKKSQKYEVIYNSQTQQNKTTELYTQVYDGKIKTLESGNKEFSLSELYENDGNSYLMANLFSRYGYSPKGWKVRVRIDREWFWYLEDGTLKLKKEYKKGDDSPVRCFKENEVIPYIPLNKISLIVAKAVWKKGIEKYTIIYNSGKKSNRIKCKYKENTGLIKRLPSKAIEYTVQVPVENNGETHFLYNIFKFVGGGYQFCGWRIRVRIGERWFWYFEDGQLLLKENVSTKLYDDIKVFSENELIPYIPANHVRVVVAEAVWKETKILKAWHRIRNMFKRKDVL